MGKHAIFWTMQNTVVAVPPVDSDALGRGFWCFKVFDEMGSRDGFFDNKLLDDFGFGVI